MGPVQMILENRSGQIFNCTGGFFWFALVCFLLFIFPANTAHGASAVRILHLAPDVGGMEVWIDGRRVATELGYTQTISYKELSPGYHRIIAKTRGDENSVVLNSRYPFRDEKEYTGLITTGGGKEDLELSISIDNCPASANIARVRFTDALANSPPVDLSVRYGPTLFSNFTFRTSSSCIPVPGGRYTLVVTKTGTPEVVFSTEMTFDPGYRYDLFLFGDLNDGEIELLSLKRTNLPDEVPKIFGVERSVVQLLGAGIIASLLILLLGQ